MITLMSWGTKHGKCPPYAANSNNYKTDLSKIVRNPFNVQALRPLNGKHPEVQAFLLRCAGFQQQLRFWTRIMKGWGTEPAGLLVNCRGGKHRSVALVELLAKELRAIGTEVTIIHRDLEKP